MSIKMLGLYGGFFVGMLALALFVTGVFQRGILPRLSPRAKSEAAESHDGSRGRQGGDGSRTGAHGSRGARRRMRQRPPQAQRQPVCRRPRVPQLVRQFGRWRRRIPRHT